MASISTNSQGLRVIQFVGTDRKRRSVRLGKAPMKVADEVCRRVELLNTSAICNCSVDGNTAQWLAKIGDDLHARLAAAGLVETRAQQQAVKLGAYLEQYIVGREDVKIGTRTNFGISKARMLAFFGDGKELHAITEGDVEDFKVFLHGKFARATVGKTLKHARQFFRSAVRRRLITVNSFDAVKAPGQVNAARSFHVTRDVAQHVLDACPDHEWRLLFALSRFGGLRCPSEHLALTWGDVDWERHRFRVRSAKTEHHDDGGERMVPLFPELRPHLEEAFDAALEGSVYVIARHREPNINLRTQLCRIIRKAGLTPWPRLFHNLRASRETELAKVYPMHVVCKWIGNSPRVAADHYLQLTEADFESAAKSAAESGAVAVQKAVQQAAAPFRNDSQETTQPRDACGVVRDSASWCETTQNHLVTPTGFEPVSRP